MVSMEQGGSNFSSAGPTKAILGEYNGWLIGQNSYGLEEINKFLGASYPELEVGWLWRLFEPRFYVLLKFWLSDLLLG